MSRKTHLPDWLNVVTETLCQEYRTPKHKMELYGEIPTCARCLEILARLNPAALVGETALEEVYAQLYEENVL